MSCGLIDHNRDLIKALVSNLILGDIIGEVDPAGC